jgi:hypothetical protein
MLRARLAKSTSRRRPRLGVDDSRNQHLVRAQRARSDAGPLVRVSRVSRFDEEIARADLLQHGPQALDADVAVVRARVAGTSPSFNQCAQLNKAWH